MRKSRPFQVLASVMISVSLIISLVAPFPVVAQSSVNSGMASLWSQLTQLTENLVSYIQNYYTPNASAQVSSGFIGHWNFDAGSGTTAADASGNGYTGTLVNGTTWSAGKVGSGSLTFDGNNDYVSIANLTTSGGGWRTFSYWVKPSTSGAIQTLSNLYLTANGKRIWIYRAASGAISLQYCNDTGCETQYSTALIDANFWNYVTVVYNETTGAASFYKNAIFSNSVTFTQRGSYTWNGDNRIGAYATGGFPFSGSLDDVRMYNKALTTSEIQSLYDLAPSLIAHWTFDEGSGTTAGNSAGSGNVGTLTNGPTWTTGKVGSGALSFDGSNDVLMLNSVNFNTGDLTFSAWIYRTTGGNANGWVMGSTGQEFAADNVNRRICFTSNNATYLCTASNTLNLNAWQHVAVVRTLSGAATIYINGTQVATGATGAPIASASWAIGNYPSAAGNVRPFAGKIDDVRVYSRLVTSSEISTMYTSAISQGPIAKWSFEEGSGTTAADSSGNGRTATLVSGPTWTTGRVGTGISLDGTDDVLKVTASLFADNFSFSGWVKQSTTAGSATQGTVFMEDNGSSRLVSLMLDRTNKRICLQTINTSNCSANNTYTTAGQWTHIAITNPATGTGGTLYVNGASIGTITSENITGGTQVGIGRYNYLDAAEFGGQIDEVSIYERVLSSAEVSGLYTATGALPSSTPTPTPTATPNPPTVNISANPTSINSGQSSTISWSSTNATSCTASGGWSGTLPVSGSQSVSPLANSVYAITCTNGGGSVTSSANVSIVGATSPPTISIFANPSSVFGGSSATLSWSTTDATTCTASGDWTGTRATSGSITVTPTVTSNYTLTCSGPGGNSSQTATLTAGAIPPPPGVPGEISSQPVVQPITSNATDVDSSTAGLQVYQGTTVQYSSSATDPGNLPLTWTWLYTINGGSEIAYSSGSGTVGNASFTYGSGTAGSTYRWILRVSNGTFSTQQTLDVSILSVPVVVDTTAPTLSGIVASNITATGATIAWNTNEAATRQIQYGLTTAYGQSTTLNSTLLTSHSQTLSNLSAGSVYHYRVISQDAAGNSATSLDNTFTTSAAPDTTAPTAVSNLSASGILTTSFTISWTAPNDPPSNSAAKTYDIRYATSPITTGNWASAIQATGEQTPATPGSNETYILAGLNSSTTYYIAIISTDTTGNVSVLSNVVTATTQAAVAPMCTSFTYSTFGACQPDGTQTRTLLTAIPSSCQGGTPVLTQSCTYVPPTCTSFTYSAFGACQADSRQTRTIISQSPLGCVGGSPVLSQSCTYVPPTTSAPQCTDFTYSSFGSCQPDGTQSRSILIQSPSSCTGGSPVLSQSCVYTPPSCTDFTYSDWGSCRPDNTQVRSITAQTPTGCINGNPVLSQSCTYVPPAVPTQPPPITGAGGATGVSVVPPPAAFTALGAQNQIVLSWTNPTSTDFVRVRIVRKEDSQPLSLTDGTIIYEGTNQGYTDTTADSNKRYYYTIFSLDRTLSPSVTAQANAKLGESSNQQQNNPIPTQTPTTPSTPGTGGGSINPLTTWLVPGSRGEAVTNLQRALVKLAYLTADSVTGFFGKLTTAALQMFQKAYNIVTNGTPDSTGYGAVGPKTRAKLNELVAGTPSIPSTPSGSTGTGGVAITITATYLQQGYRGPEVLKMQKLLVATGDLTSDNATGFFGPLTLAALKKFQCANAITCSGTPGTTGYGIMGPKTRALLMTRGNGGSSPSAPGTAQSINDQLNAAKAQLDALLKQLQNPAPSPAPTPVPTSTTTPVPTASIVPTVTPTPVITPTPTPTDSGGLVPPPPPPPPSL
jgi:hypothetical protein